MATSRIKLTRGKVAIVDRNMVTELRKYKWSAVTSSARKQWFAVSTMKDADGNKRSVVMHHFIAGKPVVHADGDTLNNTRENLIEKKPRPWSSVHGTTYKGADFMEEWTFR